MKSNTITFQLTSDEALVLLDFFARFEASDRLAFAHAAEYLALQRISAQLDTALAEPFDSRYTELLTEARARVASGFEGQIPGLRTDAP